MASSREWEVPASVQPRPQDYGYDLERALRAVVAVRANVPADAFTAGVLGTERAGNGVMVRSDGLVLTIGYLITEASEVWLGLADGRVVPGHALAYDQETGFGLVQALARLDGPALPIGRSADATIGEKVVMGGTGGRARSVAATIVARQPFAGYWEYALDEALFTAPHHPQWGGAPLIGPAGDLLGIGSLQVERAKPGSKGGKGKDRNERINMVVPIDLLKPIFDDLLAYGRPNRPPRPWLGLYATEVDDRVVVMGLADGGPADQAGMETGDIVLALAGSGVGDLGQFYRRVWSLGEAGVEVPLTIGRGGRSFDVRIASTDRARLLKRPVLQ